MRSSSFARRADDCVVEAGWLNCHLEHSNCLVPKAYLAKPLAAFGKPFVRRFATRFGFFLVPRRVLGLYTPTLRQIISTSIRISLIKVLAPS